MKLFFAREFSSLADHIALIEGGIAFEIAEVDIESRRLAGGGAYLDINPKGQVPALMFDDGQVLTENDRIQIGRLRADGALAIGLRDDMLGEALSRRVFRRAIAR
jgi:hypothetical protein